MSNYTDGSMYYITPVRDGFMGHYVPRPVSGDETDIEYVIEDKYHHKPDFFAYEYYGSPGLWWVIPRLNHMDDLVFEFEAGKTIKVMSQSRFRSFRT